MNFTYQSDNTSDYLSLEEARRRLGLDNDFDAYHLREQRDLYAASTHLALPLYLRDLEGWVRKVWDTAGR